MLACICVNQLARAQRRREFFLKRIKKKKKKEQGDSTLVYCHLNKFTSYGRKETFQFANQTPGTESQSGRRNKSHSSFNLVL